jgi:pimeloyl-ACP methyl ester carboxylesterase
VAQLTARLDIAWPDDPQPAWIAVDIIAPPGLPEGVVPVLFCLPGGGMTRKYFDLAGDGFSFARAMASRGMVCVLLDHPGTGDSFVPQDGFGMTADRIARAEAAMVIDMIGRMRAGTLHSGLPALAEILPLGVGHSMGAMLAVLQQASGRPYVALALLCFTTRGLPEVLTEEERSARETPDSGRAACRALAEKRFGVPFVDLQPAHEGSMAAAALSRAAGRMPATAAMQSMLCDNVAAEAAGIDVPLFLAAGDRDITGPPRKIPASFTACEDIDLHVLRDTGHHPFVTDAAAHLYDRFAHWVAGLPPVPP